MKKTNAMRQLDSQKINYTIVEYDPNKGISGVEVARQLGEDVAHVFKTLVTHADKNYYVFVIPVEEELDLKKAARVIGEKKLEMLPQKELLPLTGYVHGGCSPIGMKKLFPTYLHESCNDLEYCYVSGGKIGMQIQVAPKDLLKLIGASTANLIKEV